MSEFSGFVIAGVFGGPDITIDDEYFRLKRCVERGMRFTHAKDIDSVHFAFYVDGRCSQYGCAKAERLKLMRKRREAWADLGVPASAWQERSSSEVRSYLTECVEAALGLLVARLKKDKLCLECERLHEDWASVKTIYLSDAEVDISHLEPKYDLG